MTVLLLGATGKTGALVAQQLLQQGFQIRLIVRSKARLDQTLLDHTSVSIIVAQVYELSPEQLAQHVCDCEAVISCLGHNLTWAGIYGRPRDLVSAVIERLCKAIASLQPIEPIKLILMSSSGVQNLQQQERVSLSHRAVISVLRFMLPPHKDNEQAVNYLQGLDKQTAASIEWVAVRPDSLIQRESTTGYLSYASPQYDALFKPQQTSRINVAHFMVLLLISSSLWQRWKYEMPVIYDQK